MEFLAAAIQYDCIPLKKEENLAALTRMIRDAANQGAKLIVLPEMCTTGYYFFHRDAAAAMAEEITGGETVGHLVQLCAQHGCYIAAGLMEREGEILYNSAVLIGPEGFIGKHRKLHFFAPDGHWAQEGDLPITAFETPIGKIAMLICMDISFPEAARTARLLGADIICCPVNWFDPVIPSNVWVTRAYENQLFFVVANRLGEEAGFSFSGGSCVIAPNGVILDHVQQKTGIAYGTIRLPQDTESPFPSRRPELYQELSLRRFNWSRNLLALTGEGPLSLSDPAEELRPLAGYCVEQGLCLVIGGRCGRMPSTTPPLLSQRRERSTLTGRPTSPPARQAGSPPETRRGWP